MTAGTIPTDRARSPSPRLAGLIVVGIVFLIFSPCIFFDFVGWDDALIITSNPRFNPPTLATIWFYWTHPAFNLYMPMTCSLWAAAAKLGTMSTPDAAGIYLNPFVFHLAGLLCHLVATASVFGILLIAVRAVIPAALGAVVFGIHPLMVESVAFIGAMCTPLAAALALPAVWLYLSRDPSRGHAKPVLAVIFYGLSLLAKPTTVTAPVLAVVLEIAVLNRHPRQAFRAILPWILVTLPCLVWTHLIQSGVASEAIPLWSRPWIASEAAAFYLWKIVWPVTLAVDYGQTPRWLLAHPATAAACLLPFGLLLTAWVIRKRSTAIAAAMILYLVLLLPNSGLVAFDYQRVSNVADRYAYLAMIAIALFFAVGLTKAPAGIARRLAYVWVITLLIFWGVLTSLQLQTWRNGVTLFHHAVAINPQSAYCNCCLAESYLTAQDPANALIAATRSIQLNSANDQFKAMALAHPNVPLVPAPQYASDWAEAAKAHIARANALDRLNRLDEATIELTTATQMTPGNVIAITDLAFVLGRNGQDSQAQSLLRRALQIDPTFTPARTALSRTIAKKLD